jgi:hypothetical protein
MRWLIHALTRPGERVVSLFCGVAPCGVAALQLGRTYHGIEINPEYRWIAEARLAAYGRPDVEGTVGGPHHQNLGDEQVGPPPGADVVRVIYRRLEVLEEDIQETGLAEEGRRLIDRTIEILHRLRGGDDRIDHFTRSLSMSLDMRLVFARQRR